MLCQKCRQPLKLDGSLEDLNPAAYDLLVCMFSSLRDHDTRLLKLTILSSLLISSQLSQEVITSRLTITNTPSPRIITQITLYPSIAECRRPDL